MNKKKINFKLKILLAFYLDFIILINMTITKKSSLNIRNLNSANIIYLNITGYDYQKVLEPDFIPYLEISLLNGQKAEINDTGYIYIKENKKNNLTLIFKNSLESLDYIFYSSECIIDIDLTNFDSSEIISMNGMFLNCINLNKIIFNNFDTSSVIEMNSMFENCNALASLDLSNFNTSLVESMDRMFVNCENLNVLDLSNFKTPNLYSMYEMFFGCTSLKEIYLTNMDTTSVTNMGYLFFECNALTSLDISNFKANNLLASYYMFGDCLSLTSLNLSNFYTIKLRDAEGMFFTCWSLIYLDISNFDTSVIEYMDFMFCNCMSLISLNLSSFVINNVATEYFFYNCYALKTVNFNNNIYMFPYFADHMFSYCNSLTELDLSNFIFLNSEDISYFLYECRSLISVKFPKIDVKRENFITNMESMFYGCSSLESLDLSNFDSSLVTNMKNMFYNCIKLTSINLDYFDTSSALEMESMFYGCNSLTSLNLFSFNTTSVINMKSMFFGCNSLELLDLHNFDFNNTINMFSMFVGCNNLELLNIYNYNDKIDANINGIFFDTNDDLIVIINNESNTYSLSKELSSFQCILNNGFIYLKNKIKKIIFETRICLDDCFNDKIYKYEYENFCYKECPFGTKNDSYLCEQEQTECIEEYPFINLIDNSCIEKCNSNDFFNKKCALGNHDIQNVETLILNIIKGIEDGLLDELLIEVIDQGKDLKIYDNNFLYQITTSLNQISNDFQNKLTSIINLGEFENIIKEKYTMKNEKLIIFKTEQKFEESLIPFIQFEIFNSKTKERLDLSFWEYKNYYYEIYIPVSINENEIFKYDINNRYYNDICEIYSKNNIDISLFDRKREYYKNNLSLCQNNCLYKNYDSISKRVVCKCRVQNRISLLNKSILFNKIENKKRKTNFDIIKCYRLVFIKKGLIKNFGNYIFLLIILIYISLSILFYKKGYNYLCDQINKILDFKNTEYKIDNFKKGSKNEELNKDNISSILSSSKKGKLINSKSNSDIQTNLELILSKDMINNEKNKNDEKIQNEKQIDFIEYEINNFSYEEAKLKDKRKFLNYYLSLLKENHILFFALKINLDYNSYIIKICLFLFSLSVFIVINTLFFNDSIFHQIYIDNGNYNFIYNLPYIIYSILISSIIIIIAKRLSLSQNNILEFKKESKKYNLKAKAISLIKCLIIKYISFFLVSIFLFILIWYYLSCFCAVYKNTQKYLIINSIFSYLFAIVFQFIINLIPAFFRFSALKGTGKLFYEFSQITQLL